MIVNDEQSADNIRTAGLGFEILELMAKKHNTLRL